VGWLRRNLAERQIAGMTDPVSGTLRVSTATYPPSGVNATYSNYRIAGVVSGPGLPPTAVEHAGIARVATWPESGDDLPVTVDRTRPDRLVIHWDQIPTRHDLAQAAAQAAAVRMRTGLDLGVLGEAVQQTAADGRAPQWISEVTGPAQPGTDPAGAGAVAAAGAVAPAPAPAAGPVRHQLPPSTATIPVSGRVLAVREVGVPAALAPAGGVVDLTVAISDPAAGERTAVCRASFVTPADRDRVATVGVTVDLLVDPGDAGIVSLRADGPPGADG